MIRGRRFAWIGVLAIVAGVTIAPTANATPGSHLGQDRARFSIKDIRDKRVSDISGIRTNTLAGKALVAQGFAVMRSASGASAIVDRSMLRSGATSAANPRFVDLSWDGYSRNARYVVSRDGRVVGALSRGVTVFRDTAVVPGAVYRYTIAPVLPADDHSKARMWSMKVHVPQAGTNGATSTGSLRAQAVSQALAAATAATTTLTWITFIPQSRIDAPPAGCDYGSGYQFGGDGHGYDWTTSKYRTAENAVITWSSKAVAGYVSIGASHVYRKSTGALVATKTASASAMSVKKLGSGSNYVDVRMVTHASNPFCSVGAIDGAFSMDLTQSGNYSIFSGNHRQMPDHYIYIYDGGQVTNVYERDYASVLCLIGAAACDLASLVGYYGTF